MMDSSITARGTSATTGEAVGTREDVLDNRDHLLDNMSPSSRDTQAPSQPSLSYIALISKVLLSSPSKKLNLRSIYKALEKQFPHLRSRGPGWRNSVRHSLSVNDCFVKVSRCEDGRGHYWGVHKAYLQDFQDGNFRQYRRAGGRRGKVRYGSTVKRPAWMETTFIFGSFCGSRSESLAWVDPPYFLQKPHRTQMDRTNPSGQPWSLSVSCVRSPTRMRHYCSPNRPPGSSEVDLLEREHGRQPLTSELPCWKINGPTLKSLTESYDCRLTSPVRPLRFHCCWCMSSVNKDVLNPLYYRDNLNRCMNHDQVYS